jgi:glycosyltransferase involved in cell wall biosynthesis
MHKVSVIIPTYNRAAFVKEAVDSVLDQSFRDWDLTVVDDGSNDKTQGILAPYADILRYERTAHRGVSAARNEGVRLTRGEWIAFLDSDDLWLPRKLERQIQSLRDSRWTPVCYTDEIWIRNGKRVNQRARHGKHSGWIFEQCLPLCIISPSSALIRRDLLEEVGGFDEGLPACEDYDLWLRVTARHPVLFLAEKLIVKRGGHQDQLSRNYWGMDRFRVRALAKALGDTSLIPSQGQAALEELRYKCAILAQGARKRGRNRMALFYERLSTSGQWGDEDEWGEPSDFEGGAES